MPGLYLPSSFNPNYKGPGPDPVPAGSPGGAPQKAWKAPAYPYLPPAAQPIAAAEQKYLQTYSYPVTAAKELERVVPALGEPTLCPEPGCGNHEPAAPMQPIASVIVELNDRHLWTREQIADWLDTLPYDLTIQPASEGD